MVKGIYRHPTVHIIQNSEGQMLPLSTGNNARISDFITSFDTVSESSQCNVVRENKSWGLERKRLKITLIVDEMIFLNAENSKAIYTIFYVQ